MMVRYALIGMAMLAVPGAAFAGGGCSYGHAVQETVAEVEPVQTPMPGADMVAEETLVASLTDCTTLSGDALVQCLAAQAAK